MSYDRLPDRIAGQMTVSQASTLRSLAGEAYQEKLFEPGLSAPEAARRIDLLKQRDRAGELVLLFRRRNHSARALISNICLSHGSLQQVEHEDKVYRDQELIRLKIVKVIDRLLRSQSAVQFIRRQLGRRHRRSIFHVIDCPYGGRHLL